MSLHISYKVNLFAKIITAPFVGLVYAGAIGSAFWLDLVYSVAVFLLLQQLLAFVVF